MDGKEAEVSKNPALVAQPIPANAQMQFARGYIWRANAKTDTPRPSYSLVRERPHTPRSHR